MKNRTLIILVVVALFVICNVTLCLTGLIVGGVWSALRLHRRARTLPMDRPEPWPIVPTPRAERLNVGVAALVVGVDPDGPADEAGIEIGDLILALDGERLQRGTNLRALLSTYEPGDRIELTIRRGVRTRQIQVELGQREDSDLPHLGLTFRIVPLAQEID